MNPRPKPLAAGTRPTPRPIAAHGWPISAPWSAPASSSAARNWTGPEAGTTVRSRDGRRWVQDGPVADTKEHLGGYAVIDVDSRDTAIEWAARSPCAASGAGVD